MANHSTIYTSEFPLSAHQDIVAEKKLLNVTEGFPSSDNRRLRWKNETLSVTQSPVSTTPYAYQGVTTKNKTDLFFKKSELQESTPAVSNTVFSATVNEQDSASSEVPTTDIPNPPHSDIVKEEVVRLLNMGQRVGQIAALLRVPSSLVYRLRSQCMKESQLEEDVTIRTDGRRLYSNAFKREAIQQIQSGVPVREVSKTLGVTPITLYKWKKASQLLMRSDEPLGDNVEQLREQLREALEERDALKKALLILLRS